MVPPLVLMFLGLFIPAAAFSTMSAPADSSAAAAAAAPAATPAPAATASAAAAPASSSTDLPPLSGTDKLTQMMIQKSITTLATNKQLAHRGILILLRNLYGVLFGPMFSQSWLVFPPQAACTGRIRCPVRSPGFGISPRHQTRGCASAE
jgi:hypothetical protein